MKILVSGAAGFLGRAVTAELAGRGHEVYGLVRNPGKVSIVEEAGGHPVIGNLIDSGNWCKVARESDSIISLTQPFKEGEEISPENYETYGHKHAETVTNLIKAAADGNAKSVIVTYHSLCLGDRGGRWVTDADAHNPVGVCRPLTGSFEAVERTAEDAGLPLVGMYPSLVYGNGGWFKRLVEDLQYGKARIAGQGDNYLSLIHVDDLASMYALAAEKITNNETFCLSDDRPVRQGVLMSFLADLLDLPEPKSVELEKYASMFGLIAAETMASSTRVPGQKAMDLLGHVPKLRSYESGIPFTLKSMGIEPRKMEEAA